METCKALTFVLHEDYLKVKLAGNNITLPHGQTIEWLFHNDFSPEIIGRVLCVLIVFMECDFFKKWTLKVFLNIWLRKGTHLFASLISFITLYFFQTPSTKAEWKAIARGLSSKWQFSHCFGAIDDKHIFIQPVLARAEASSTTTSRNF